jgi:metal-dependent amidase/aminoacylase/carboxypeptidase family protein
MPHNGVDPVPVARQIVQTFQTILTRNKHPLDTGVISVTKVYAGQAVNVVPDHHALEGTVRTFAEDVLEFRPTMGAEDSSFFLQAKPGSYFLIGNGDGGHRDGGHGLGPCMLRNPGYDFNDALFPIGGSAWVRIAEAWLAIPPPGGTP